MITKSDLQDLARVHDCAETAVAHAMADLRASLTRTRYPPKIGSHVHMEMRRDFPYVIHDTKLPGVQILVNRNYKPLGATSTDWLVYEDFPNLHVRLSPDQIAALVKPPHERGLFGDGSAPWRGRKEASAYLKRLDLLLNFLNLSRRSPPESPRATP